ncbi:unnamed protein product [Adineta ricciae]|uniref:Alkaline ceramidase n=1 Tax=Adineta ricciae TaxID=249248 RepID=A0A814FAA6_ADIRI|nr:unnamed protein product [Adineta ricciae]CAF1186360.1 unnamed protein product [Adineta ricciae]
MSIFIISCLLLSLLNGIDGRSLLKSHENPSDVKHFESQLDDTIGFWSPSTSSIDWCERNYVVTYYIAEFWNCISSLLMCLFSLILIVRGLYYRIERRFTLLSFSFGLVGFGSAYFHGTLTHFGQMADELPMVYSMIIWWFILFRMNKHHLASQHISPIDVLIVFGIAYGFLCSYIHSLKTFVIVFQAHFTLMVIGGIVKLIFLYRQTQHHTNNIKYLILWYVGLLIPAVICWLVDQQLCEYFNSKNAFNPQLHAWWHVLCAIDAYVGVVCGEALRRLSIRCNKYEGNKKLFKPQDHLRIRFYLGLPFVDYSTHQENKTD